MGQKWITVLCVVVAMGLASRATVAAEPTVEVRGIRVVGKGYAPEPDQVRAFNWFPGTTISALVVMPEGGLIDVVKKESKLTRYTDNKGTDLLKAKGKFSRPEISASSFNFSKDKKASIIEIKTPGIPAKGATTLTAEGVVTFKTGTEQKTFTHKDFSVKVGTAIDAGPVQFTVLKAGKPQWGNAKFALTLKATQDISNIAKMRFLDAAGKPIKTRDGGTMSSSSFGKFKVQKSFNFPEKLDKVTLEITYWMDAKSVKVPFKLTTSLGM